MLSHFRSDVCNIIADNEFCPLLTVSFDTATLQIAIIRSKHVCMPIARAKGSMHIMSINDGNVRHQHEDVL